MMLLTLTPRALLLNNKNPSKLPLLSRELGLKVKLKAAADRAGPLLKMMFLTRK